jgi:RNA polymerase-binding transcription factor DksA
MANKKLTPEERLQQRVQELEALKRAEHETAFGGDQREVTGELSRADQHPADVADVTFQRELQLTTEIILEREAEQAREALKRSQEGTYGICENCGRRIPKERLEARPEATLCVDCQRLFEERGAG